MSNCCMCNKPIEREDPAVLAMGAAGIPRLLCDDCEELLDKATKSRDYDEISDSIGEIAKLVADKDPDVITYSALTQLMENASERAKAIKDGDYDFSLDEEDSSDDGLDEIPEELRESEEDKEKDRIEEEKQKKFDKIYNYVLIVVCIGFAGFLIYKLIETFFLK